MAKPKIKLNTKGMRDMYRDHAIPECLRRGRQAAASAGEGFEAGVGTWKKGKKEFVFVRAVTPAAFRAEAKSGALSKAMGRLPRG